MTEQIPPLEPSEITEQPTAFDRITAALRMFGQKDYDDLCLGVGIDELKAVDDVIQRGVQAVRDLVGKHNSPRP
jgi:hypothetical protein